MAEIPPQIAMNASSVCPQCQLEGVPEMRVVGPHLGAYCATCGSHIRWVPKKGTWIALSRLQGVEVPNG
jgi:hypothetical protein